MRLSLIIPTLNEATGLERTIATARDAARGDLQVIVSDCDSTDGTADIARQLGVAVATGSRSRATAMNRGAALADGRVLLFVHADTRLPDGFDRAVCRAIRGGCVGGAFDFSFGSDDRVRGLSKQKLKLVRILNRVRFRWKRTFYGDQAIFCRRDVFESLGGYRDLPLFEDVRLSKAMRRRGRLAILQPPVKTSPRRFVEKGILRQMLRDMVLMGLDGCGVCPKRMWAAYNRHNRKVTPASSPAG